MKHFLFTFLLLFTLQTQAQNIVDPSTVTIARDEYGVPHIFAPTDAGVAYGLAWANAEDAFDRMQELLLMSKGMLAKHSGKEGAAGDFFAHAIGARELVDKLYDTDELSDAYKTYLKGFCEGINAYAAAHPKEVFVKKAFPIHPKDVVTTYTIAFSALSGVAGAVGEAVDGEFNKKSFGLGSNAFALGSTKTTDGNTYLCTNPHFLIEGVFSFYEAHLCSEEGLNITGAIFQGGTSIFMGNNEHLAWGKTYNHFDGVDIFELKMHPKKKNVYELDGEWKKLEKRKIWLKVKLGKFLTLPVPQTTYWSEFGPTIKSKNGKYYGIRSHAYERIGAGQQFYEMNKATNFKEFKAALDKQRIAMFNLVYADKDDNLYYLTNGFIPQKDPTVNWKEVQSGATSEKLWTQIYPLDSLPQVLNPSCGYVFNTNNTPFNATCAEENDNPKRLPSYVDVRPGDNNRAERFQELISGKEHFNYDDFKAMKFDAQFPASSNFLETMKVMRQINASKYPAISDAIELLQQWKGDIHLESTSATILALTIDNIFREKKYGDEVFVLGVDVDEKLLVRSIRKAKEYLYKHHQKLEVPLKKLQRFVRHGKDYPVSGFSDVLMANYAAPYKDGKYRIIFGDTYIHFVSFNSGGVEKIETLLPFGTHRNVEKYTDQLPMYNAHQTKTMTLDKEKVLKTAIKVYNPQ